MAKWHPNTYPWMRQIYKYLVHVWAQREVVLILLSIHQWKSISLMRCLLWVVCSRWSFYPPGDLGKSIWGGVDHTPRALCRWCGQDEFGKVCDSNTQAPFPTLKVQYVSQALDTFIVWPKHLVKPISHKVFSYVYLYWEILI